MSGSRPLALRVGGATVTLQIADPALRRLVDEHWGAFVVAPPPRARLDAILRFHDRGPALRTLAHPQIFVTDHVLVLTDRRRYLLTGYMYDRPWEFDCRALPRWDAPFIYYYVLEPLLLDILKTRDVLVWHAAAVERNGRAVLLPGQSGSGKSTTVLTLLALGWRFMADDVSVLSKDDNRIRVSGRETSLFVTSGSLDLVPEWRRLRSRVRRRKGTQWKYRLDLSRVRSTRAQSRVTTLLFPHVTRRAGTSIERIDPGTALAECLAQAPREYPASTLGRAAFERQFELYSTLVQSATCFRLALGSNQPQLRAVLSGLTASR